jgi:hypothetical protein
MAAQAPAMRACDGSAAGLHTAWDILARKRDSKSNTQRATEGPRHVPGLMAMAMAMAMADDGRQCVDDEEQAAAAARRRWAAQSSADMAVDCWVLRVVEC